MYLDCRLKRRFKCGILAVSFSAALVVERKGWKIQAFLVTMTKVALRKLQGPYTLNLVEHCTGVAEVRVQILSKEMFLESP